MLAELLRPHLTSTSTLGDCEIRLSYQEFYDRIVTLQQELKGKGISAHQLILVETYNTLENLLTLSALMDMGAVVVPFNPAFTPQQREQILARNRYAFLLDASGCHKLKGEVPVADLAISNGIFTSGSTGTPKLACHSLSNHLASARAAARINPTITQDHWHLSLPLFHIGGLSVLYRSLLAGASLTIGGRVEDPQFLSEMGITHASMVATQLQRFQDVYTDHNLALKTLLVGGGPASEALLASLPELPLRRTYGMSEISSQACTQGPDGDMHLLESVQLKIAGDGELLLTGESLFAGYLENNTLLKPDSWFATGDLGEWQNGQLVITGRKDNLFISGGENIQPEAIEQQLVQLPGVNNALVVPVPSAEFGFRPFAWVDCTVREQLEELRHLAQQRLPGFMLPVAFVQIPEDMLKKGLKLPRKTLTALAADYWVNQGK